MSFRKKKRRDFTIVYEDEHILIADKKQDYSAWTVQEKQRGRLLVR